MSLPHPKFLKPVASSPDQVVSLPCRVCGLSHLLALLDTLLLRFLQSSPHDRDSDLGANSLLSILALLDAYLDHQVLANLYLPVHGEAEQHFKV